jgi:hypothetical protein
MNTALEFSTRVVQKGGRRCKKSTLNDLVHLTPLRIPLMNPPTEEENNGYVVFKLNIHGSAWRVVLREGRCSITPPAPTPSPHSRLQRPNS